MANDMLTEIQFWAQVTRDSARTIVCSPELESRIKGWLTAQGLDGLHAVAVHPFMSDDRIYVIDEQAIAAEFSRPLKLNVWP